MSFKHNCKIVIASDIDYEELVAEIYLGDFYIGLLQQEEGIGNVKVEFAPDLEALDLSWLRLALNEAEKKLRNE